MTSKRMLLFPPGGPWRTSSPTLVQKATNRAALSNIFGVATTPGNLLLYLMTQRQAAAHAPSDGETWTTLQTGQFQRTSDATENGIGAYACVCTIAQTNHATVSLTNSVMYEIANSSLAGITSLLVSDHASGTAVDIGSLGTPDTGRLAFLLGGNGSDGTGETVTPGVWVVDFFADRDLSSTTNTLAGGGAFPQTWYGHAAGAGAALQARIDLSVTQKYGGIAVLLA